MIRNVGSSPMRGADPVMPITSMRMAGPSPLVRDRLALRRQRGGGGGDHPSDAGPTACRRRRHRPAWDHPCGCGADGRPTPA